MNRRFIHQHNLRRAGARGALTAMATVITVIILAFASTPASAATSYLSGMECGSGTVRLSSHAAGEGSSGYVQHRWDFGGISKYQIWHSTAYAWRYSAATDFGDRNLHAITGGRVKTHDGGIIGSASRYCLY